MRIFFIFWITLFLGCASSKQTPSTETSSDRISSGNKFSGFFPFYWNEKEGRIWLEISNLDEEFLYVSSLQAGIGSNDIGLDRGQLGPERVVKFSRSGDKVLLIQLNYGFRAQSPNREERLAVEEAFAQSVLWGFKVITEKDGRIYVDATSFLLRDAHDVSRQLKDKDQGTYKVDETRSAIYLPNTKNFPDNTEFEATVTFTGEAKGEWIRSVTPSPDAVSVRIHHSFVKLPDDNYQPRTFDPRCGYYEMSYYDFATPLDQPIVKRFITRHRLHKKDPSAAISDPVDPIVYYLDPGTPEPIRSALLDGASWWNQAFEAAGYRNAFQVKMLPPDADPMDVRYNIIQWVHRSSRGWSYGSSVTDPRTGEIIKGKVTLGSLRVRQDFLIAQGLLAAYEDDSVPDPRLQEMALARLRQLSAHEVGHTLGLTHNFAASYNDRSSVMDYPHPYITLNEKGEIDFSQAYDNKIGSWDIRTILYGYQDFPDGTDETEALNEILLENHARSYLFLSDADARPEGSAHPVTHLWDNGKSPADELRRLSSVRNKALEQFNLNNIPAGTPVAHLERLLVPLFLAHRYQVEATSKLIGGVNYTYTVKGFETERNDDWKVRPVGDRIQQDALTALLETLDTRYLEIPQHIRKIIPPQPMGYKRDKETFQSHTGLVFDPLAAAESAASYTIRFLLHPQRLSRLIEQRADDPARIMSVTHVFDALIRKVFLNNRETVYQEEIAWIVEKQVIRELISLAANRTGNRQVPALALFELDRLGEDLLDQYKTEEVEERRAHLLYMLDEISRFRQRPSDYIPSREPVMPAGSPIGCGE